MVALEAGAGDDVEDTVGAVADVGGVTAALDFDVVDVLGVDLCAEVAADVRVWNLHAIDEPTNLMTAAHVQHVMGDVGAWDVVGDHGQAVGAVGAGGLGDVFATDEGGWGDGVAVGGVGFARDRDGLLDGAELQLEVQDGGGIGGEGEGLSGCGEAGLRDSDDVVAERDKGDGEGAVCGGERRFGEGGVAGVDFDVGAGNGAMLRVVYDSMDLAKDSGVCRGGT